MKIYNYSFPFLIQQLNFNFLLFLELDHFGVEAETLECYIEKVFEGVRFGSDDFHEIFGVNFKENVCYCFVVVVVYFTGLETSVFNIVDESKHDLIISKVTSLL